MATENATDRDTTDPQGNYSIAPTPFGSSAASTGTQSFLRQAAFAQALPQATSLGEVELVPVNIDVHSAVSTAIRALPRIMAFRGEASKLPGFDISHFDHLQLYTYALDHAQATLVAASAPLEAIGELKERGVKLRDAMYLDAGALAHRGLLDRDRLTDFKAKVGYKNLVSDLLGLSTLLRERWHKIAPRTGVQLNELEEAELLAQQLMAAVGAREQAAEIVAQAQAQRQRNFTLFSRSYNQVRRAILFLRWDHDDLDQICPSLYAGRGGGRREQRTQGRLHLK